MVVATIGSGCDRGSVANGVEVQGLHVETRTHDDVEFELVIADFTEVECRFHWKNDGGEPIATIAALPSFDFATNGGIYQPDLVPAGLYIENGEVLSPLNLDDGAGNFFLKPNGVFLIQGAEARIVVAAKYDADAMNADYAIQSGPLLVIDGEIHPAFNIDSENRYIRSGVGVQSVHKVVFALSTEPVTFHEFASLFRDQLGCANALYLDGAISTFTYRDGPMPVQSSPYATMITVSERKD